MIAVNSFSYAVWKLMEDLATEKNTTVMELGRE